MAIFTRDRKTRKQSDMEGAIDRAVSKALAPYIGQAASQPVSGATYPMQIPRSVNPSSPFSQTAGSQAGAMPLPRPPGDFNSLFGPGTPFFPDALDPIEPWGRTMPRRNQYMVAQNLQLIDRAVPWTLLYNIAENCDVVTRCIQLVQDGMVGREWSWGFSPDIIQQIMAEQGLSNHARAMDLAKDKYGDELNRVKQFFLRPDQRSGYSFSQWLTELLFSHLVYDAVCIYPQYTLGGELFSLNGIDGSTIKILKDNQGFPPQPPAPAYQQILYGFPRGEYQQTDGPVDGEYMHDQLLYYMRRPRPQSVYGYPQVEEVLTIATTYLARQAWMAAEYSYGAQPRTYFKGTGETGWTPEQYAGFEQTLNDRLSGQIHRRQQGFLLPGNMEPVFTPQIQDKYHSDYDAFLILQMGSKFGVPGVQLGIQAKAGLSGGKQMEGEEDQTEHFVFTALINFTIDILNDIARRHLDVGPEITATCQDPGGSEQDILQQANADKTIVSFGGMTLNDFKSSRGEPLYDMPEADEPMIITATGPVFLKGTLAIQDANTEATLNPPEPPKQVMVGPDGTPQLPQTTGAASDGSSNDNADTGHESGNSPTHGTTTDTDGNTELSGTGGTSDNKGSSSTNESSAEKELRAFAKFAKSRTGRSWRDFQFAAVDAVRAGQLNTLGAAGDLDAIYNAVKDTEAVPKADAQTTGLTTLKSARPNDEIRDRIAQYYAPLLAQSLMQSTTGIHAAITAAQGSPAG